ncbi:sulfite exporter TauE/SafE family protein [Polaribacter sp. P097]|uniref:sulfite exporter TauE/SafE family protein n=1 Tax=Polaribacter sp. P097 TaxID=3117398 RepID=UPI002FE3AA6D
MNLDLILELINSHWFIILLFFVVALLYSSVGFGGGSSYLAILALTSLTFTQIRATALLCNIVVVLGNVIIFHRNKQLNYKKITPLVLLSIPFAYLGGYLKISENLFFILLGSTLVFASVTMWLSKKIVSNSNANQENKLGQNAATGSIIGFISGMVGIGGGIFLAPILHLTNWDTPKKIAATASMFILVNSTAGFFGQSTNPDFQINWSLTSILLVTVFIGGQIGNRISNNFFTPIQLKKATAILIAFVGIKILYDFLF